MVKLEIIIITEMVGGSISVISSLFIIVLILRSRTRFSDTFHRIMVGLSLADIFLSIALSFGTIPSPMGAATFARGNTATCDVQGFFDIFGALSAPFYSISLQLYFLLRIKYGMEKKKLVKNVEPLLHAVPVVYGLISAIIPLSLGSINPTGYSTCFITSHPFGCSGGIANEIGSDDSNCTRGIKVNPKLLRWVLMGIPYLIIFISICVTSWMMYFAMRELELKKKEHMFLPSNETLRISVMEEQRIHEKSQKILKRALSYLAAFALSFINILIFGIVIYTGHYNSMFHLVAVFFFSLHGLYNLIVFLWPKVIKLREDNEDISVLKNVIIAFSTYDRTVHSIAARTYDRAVQRHDNTASSTRNRISLNDYWLGRSLSEKSPINSTTGNLNICENEMSDQNTQKNSDRKDVRHRESNGLNTSRHPIGKSDGLSEYKENSLISSFRSLSDSDAISLRESEKNALNTSFQSVRDSDAPSLSEVQNESEIENSSV